MSAASAVAPAHAPGSDRRRRGGALIAIEGVSKSYDRGGSAAPALAGVSLEVADREFVALVGPTGCGKTTLLRLVAGLLEPSSGSISIGGRRVSGPSRRVGMAFQRPVLLPWRTVRRNLALPAQLAGRRSLQHADRIEELLLRSGLDRHRDAYPRELSLGMQQIVSFCMALALDPDVLLVDEPFASLDALSRERLAQTTLSIWSAFRKTVLFVTHSIPEAVFVAERVVVLSARPGRVLGTVAVDLPQPRTLELLREPRFHELADTVRGLLDDGAA
jgi:NitT/TauT family transport system ATP-binding protein